MSSVGNSMVRSAVMVGALAGLLGPGCSKGSSANGSTGGAAGDSKGTGGTTANPGPGDATGTGGGGPGTGGPGSGTGGNTGANGTATGGALAGGSSPDGGVKDALSPSDAGAGVATQDGAVVSCIRGIYGMYVLRADGIALYEGGTNKEQTIVDAATGLPLTGISGLQGGASHGCGVLATGAVSCWQTVVSSGNTSGQLGNGTTDASAVQYRATPVLTGPNTPLANVMALATGGESNTGLNSTCAVTTDKQLWCWGDLTWIVNNGTALKSGYAQAITSDGMNPLTGVIQAAVAPTEACALVEGSPNSVWCWGINTNNELAQGDTVNKRYPVKVLGLTAPAKVIIANSYYTANTVCVIDGENVRCWGNNVNGSVGANVTTNPVPSPTLVLTQAGAALAGVAEIAPGTADVAVLRSDKTLWIWGQTHDPFAANYGLTNILAIGYAGGYGANGPRFLTSDGVYHNDKTVVPVNCGALQ